MRTGQCPPILPNSSGACQMAIQVVRSEMRAGQCGGWAYCRLMRQQALWAQNVAPQTPPALCSKRSATARRTSSVARFEGTDQARHGQEAPPCAGRDAVGPVLLNYEYSTTLRVQLTQLYQKKIPEIWPGALPRTHHHDISGPGRPAPDWDLGGCESMILAAEYTPGGRVHCS